MHRSRVGTESATVPFKFVIMLEGQNIPSAGASVGLSLFVGGSKRFLFAQPVAVTSVRVHDPVTS